MHDDAMIRVFVNFVTSGMLQSFPLTEISSRYFGVTKPVGVSNGKGNMTYFYFLTSGTRQEWLGNLLLYYTVIQALQFTRG